MKILQIVTLVSPDAAYGGPTRVAFNQADALGHLGHQVDLAAVGRGYGYGPKILAGRKIHLFPGRSMIPRSGFAGLASPALWRWVAEHVDEYDVIHVHAARDLVTLPAAAIASRNGIPLVLQTHGMIDSTNRFLARPLDRWLTRPVLRNAAAVLYLTDTERTGLLSVEPNQRIHELRNGTPKHQQQAKARSHHEALFLARLHKRKRPELFARAAIHLCDQHPSWRFTLVGPDEGESSRVETLISQAGKESVVTWEGPLLPEQALERMSRASIYVLPSIDEPFPMSVLEAMSTGIPVIVTDTCGVATEIADAGAGAVVNDSLESLIGAMDQLMSSHATRESKGRNAKRLADEEFSMETVARRLSAIYDNAVLNR